jgi:hypothetical protein
MVRKALLASSALLALSAGASADAEQAYKALRDAILEVDQSDVDDRDGEQRLLEYLRGLGAKHGQELIRKSDTAPGGGGSKEDPPRD